MAFLSSLAPLVALLLLHRMRPARHLLFWALALVAMALSYGTAALAEHHAQARPLLALEQLFGLSAAWALFLGVRLYLGQPVQRWLGLAALLLALSLGWALASLQMGFAVAALPLSALQSAPVAWSGQALARSRGSRAQRLAGWALIVWAGHLLTYPFLRRAAGFVPWAYTVCTVLSWGAAAGILLGHLQQLRAQAEQQEQRFRQILENLQLIAVQVDAQLRLTYANPYFLSLTGYREEEVLGKEWIETFVTPERRAAIRQAWKDFAERGMENLPQVYEIQTRTGERRTIRWHRTVLRSKGGEIAGIASIGEDLTDKLRSEQQLALSEERYRLFAEHSLDAIVITDEDGRIAEWNSSAERVFGLKREEALGRYLWEVQAQCAAPEKRHPGLEQEVEAVIRELLEKGSAPWVGKLIQKEILPPDGKRRVVQTVAFPIPTGKGHLAASITRDITEFARLEEQYRQAQRLEGIGRLAGGIAHDFNNILTAILGYAEFLKEAVREGQPRQDLEGLIRAAQRAQRLTQQLLAYARRQLLQPQVVDLNELVRGIAGMLRPLLGEDVQLELVLAPALHPVRVDPGQIEQVLVNLAVNARDAMPGGGKLLLQTENVELRAQDEVADLAPGRYVLLTVQDTGIGMSEEVLEHIFEPFFTTKEVGKGTGLGLATVYGIIRQHGGSVTVESRPGRGTTFRLYLPAAVEGAEEPVPEDIPLLRGHGETVLLVEDDVPVREVLGRTLRLLGYRVLEAQGAQEALSLAAAHEGELHALCTDITMPGQTGLELARTLRQGRPDLAVLYISGYPRERLAEGNGLDGQLLFKPFTALELARALREALDSKRG